MKGIGNKTRECVGAFERENEKRAVTCTYNREKKSGMRLNGEMMDVARVLYKSEKKIENAILETVQVLSPKPQQRATANADPEPLNTSLLGCCSQKHRR